MSRRLWDDFAARGAWSPLSARNRSGKRIYPHTLMAGVVTHDPDSYVNIDEKDLDPFREMPTVVVIDNVADYFYRGTDQEHWDARDDFPNIAPPWQHAFYEYVAPPFSISEDFGRVERDFTQAPRRVGSHVMSVRLEQATGDAYDGWACVAYFICDFDGQGLICLPWTTAWRVAPDGQLLMADGGRLDANGDPAPWLMHRRLDPAIPDEVMLNLAPDLLYPMWLAVSLSHCKNVEVVQIAPPPKLAKKHAKNGRPLHDFHVLNIEPMTRRIQAAGANAAPGEKTKMGMHIVRGQFRDYRQRGLFGKHKGVYWFDSHVKGSGPRTVDKTYNVRSPE